MGKKHISTEIFTYMSVGFLVIIMLICGIFLMYQKEIVFEKVNASISGILNQTSNTLTDKLERTEALARTLKLNSTLLTTLKKEPNYEDAKAVDKMISEMGNSKIWGEEYITILGKNGYLFVNWENDGRNRYSKGIQDLQRRLAGDSGSLELRPYEMFVGFENPDRFDKNRTLMGVTSFLYDDMDITNRLGIIQVSISEKSVIRVMEENKVFEGSEVYMVDREGKILLSTGTGKEGEFLDLGEGLLRGRAMTSGFCGISQDGNRMMAFYQGLNSEWTQVMVIPYSSYTSQMRLMLLTLGAVAVLAVFLSMLISLLISYSISKPIKELEQSIDQITGGDLKNRVRVVRRDDIGKLGVHFNEMADHLEHLIEEKIENQKRTSELVIANKTAELKMLHAQINPHFLFNTLNSIRCLAIINKADYIAHMLESLGGLLENSIMKGGDNTSIRREVALLNKYIELQQMRYGKRLKAEILVEDEILDMEIPRFMLQPLVENAITHGISSKVEGGSITVLGGLKDKMVCLQVEDDGVGLDAHPFHKSEKQQEHSHGIGISNIRDRLHLIYGEDCELEIKAGREGCGTLAVLRFPAVMFGGEKINAKSDDCG